MEEVNTSNNLNNSLSDNNYSTNSLKSIIGEFCGKKSELTGTGWNEYREVIEGYQNTIQNINNNTSSFQSTLSSLSQEVNNCLNGYTGNIRVPETINNFNSEISNIESEITACKNRITTLEGELIKTKRIPILSLEEIISWKTVTYEDKGAKAKIQNEQDKLDNLKKYQDLINTLYKIKTKYEGAFEELLTAFKNINKNL